MIEERLLEARKERFSVFCRALAVLAQKPNFLWQVYLDREVITADGDVLSVARPEAGTSSDVEELLEYCRHLDGQGFNISVVVAVEADELCVVAWEEIEPDWPSDMRIAVELRWQPYC